MTDAIQAHGLRLLTARKLDPSPRNLTAASRRAFAAGRLAELGAHMVPGLLHVESVEHGEPDAMSPGSIFARCWLDARDDAEWHERSRQLLELEAAHLAQYRITLAVYRATRWTRAAAWLRWTTHRLVG